MTPPDAEALAAELDHLGYHGLFGLPGAEQQRDELWHRSGAPDLLLRLATDDAQPWRTRFLASEVIFDREMFLLLHRPELFASLAQVYAKALTEDASGFMAHWGFLQDMNDTGTLGSRFITFGRNSDAALRPLLDEPRGVPYLDPPDYPSHFRLGFRVKDFAALYLIKIYDLPLHLTEDAAQRDGEIRRLKQLLP